MMKFYNYNRSMKVKSLIFYLLFNCFISKKTNSNQLSYTFNKKNSNQLSHIFDKEKKKFFLKKKQKNNFKLRKERWKSFLNISCNFLILLLKIYFLIALVCYFDPTYCDSKSNQLGNYFIPFKESREYNGIDYLQWINNNNCWKEFIKTCQFANQSIILNCFNANPVNKNSLDINKSIITILEKNRSNIETISSYFTEDDKFFYKEVNSEKVQSIKIKDLILKTMLDKNDNLNLKHKEIQELGYNIWFFIYCYRLEEDNIFIKRLNKKLINILKNHNTEDKAYKQIWIENYNSMKFFNKLKVLGNYILDCFLWPKFFVSNFLIWGY